MASIVEKTYPLLDDEWSSVRGVAVGSVDSNGLWSPASQSSPLPIGGVGVTASASFTPAAAAYGALDILSVAQQFSFTFANGLAVPSGSLIRILTSVIKSDQASVPAGMTSFNLQCYSVTPPSAQADNDLWALASADLAAYRGALDLGTPVDLGAALFFKQSFVDTDIKLAGTSLFGELQTVGSFTAPTTPIEVALYGMVV